MSLPFFGVVRLMIFLYDDPIILFVGCQMLFDPFFLLLGYQTICLTQAEPGRALFGGPLKVNILVGRTGPGPFLATLSELWFPQLAICLAFGPRSSPTSPAGPVLRL